MQKLAQGAELQLGNVREIRKINWSNPKRLSTPFVDVTLV